MEISSSACAFPEKGISNIWADTSENIVVLNIVLQGCIYDETAGDWIMNYFAVNSQPVNI